MTEHTPYDIAQINFGNRMLDNFLLNEQAFYKSLDGSEALRFGLDMVYVTLQNLGVLPIFWKSDHFDAQKEAIAWCPGSEGLKLNSVTRAVIVISHFAEKRLAVTAGT